MTSTDIYSILSSKPHNPHHLKRYWKFIQWCKKSNATLRRNTYTEEHHIAPKAKDLFPQYEKENWNFVSLTARQHIISHVMLWKIYGGSQTSALFCLLTKFNSSTNIFLKERKIPHSISIRYAAKIREEHNIKIQGWGSFKDDKDKRFFLHNEDPIIKELNLVGLRKGEIQEKGFAIYKDIDGNKYRLKVNDPQINELNLVGNSKGYIRTEKQREKMKGRSSWATPDGVFFDFITRDDPRITELGLIPLDSDNRKAQRIRRQEAAVEANTDSQYYNNGTEHKKFKEDPGIPWVLGCLDWNRDNQKVAASKKRKDTFVVNNGVTNIYLKNGEPIPEGFTLGMKPRNKVVQ